MTQIVYCENGPHDLPEGRSVLLHNVGGEDEPRLVCHDCWCIFCGDSHAPLPARRVVAS